VNDFLGRLAERSLGVGQIVRPRVAPLFAPRPLVVEEVREVESEAPPPPRPRPPVAEPEAEPAAAVPARVEHAPPPVVSPVVEASETEPHVREVERVEDVHEIVVERVVAGTEPVPPVAVGTAPEGPRPAVQEPEPVEPSRGLRPEPTPRPTRTVERRPPARTVVRAAEPAPSPPEPHESWLEPPPATLDRPLASLAPPPTEPPVVRVTIGRVDVRAVLPPPAAERTPPKRAPRLTLEEYLREGRRS
jgi:hypothetical protein